MKLSSFRALSFVALSLAALIQSPVLAATVSDGKRSVPIKAPTKAEPPLVLPARSDVLTVAWVDTKNAKLAIGGITYSVMGALPSIVLANGEKVSNIGYLKSGMHVRIRTNAEGAGHARLAEITVVGQNAT